MVQCAICQAEDGGRHYGGICCLRCKNFYRRAVRLKLNYKCKVQGDCQIRALDRRACHGCRFEKCQRIGMNPKLVHSDRTCDSDAIIVYRRQREQTNQMAVTDLRKKEEWYNGVITASRRLISNFNGPLAERTLLQLPNLKNVNSLVGYVQKIDLLLDSYFEEVPSTYSNINMSVEQGFFFEPRRLTPRYQIQWEPLRLFTTDIYRQIWCRMICWYVDWCSYVLKLHPNLNPSDKLKMTVGRCIVSSCILISNKSIPKYAKKKCLLMTENMYIPLEATELAHCKRDPIFDCLLRMGSYYYEQFVEPSRELNITEEEFSLLKLIAFFNAVPNLSVEGRKIVTDAQLHYQSLLIQSLRSKMNDREAIHRMTSLLSLLPPLEQLDEMEMNAMYLTTLLNYNNMKGSLTEDFYIKRRIRV
ncbi:Zinc finger, C4 type [Aphelenchoides besseyi]|nr:Zinc finger, C4 type [Aphelenchoides besseyi]